MKKRLRLSGCDGQASLEYVVVASLLIVVVVALGAFWRFSAESGGMSASVEKSQSHAIGEEGGITDVLLY